MNVAYNFNQCQYQVHLHVCRNCTFFVIKAFTYVVAIIDLIEYYNFGLEEASRGISRKPSTSSQATISISRYVITFH